MPRTRELTEHQKTVIAKVRTKKNQRRKAKRKANKVKKGV